MHIVITGGAGFIGHHAVKKALDRGWKVSVLDNFSTGKLSNLASPPDKLPINLSVYNCDIALSELPNFKSIDCLLHFAAPVAVVESLQNPDKYHRGIIQGSKRVFEWAKESGCNHIIAASTAAVYGDREDIPFLEDSLLQPMSPYAEYKLQMEEILKSYHSPNLKCTALRFFNVFGEGQPDDTGYVSVVPIFKKQYEASKPITVTGDGKQTRDFIYVGDIVNACFGVIDSKYDSEKMFIMNIGSGKEIAVLDIANAFEGSIEYIEQRKEPKRSLGDIKLVLSMLDWKPITSVIDWIKDNK